MALTKLSLMPQANVTTPCSQLITHNGIMVHKPPTFTHENVSFEAEKQKQDSTTDLVELDRYRLY